MGVKMKGELWDLVASVFYPKRCPCCGEVKREYRPCKSCEAALDSVRIKGTSCFKCGEPLRECRCGGFNPLYNGVIAPFKRQGAAKNAIYALKFHAKFYPSKYFGKEMAAEFKRRCPKETIDIICVVPMTAKERSQKLCDQVRELAKYTVNEFDAVYDPTLIKKIRETKRQRELKRSERAINVKDAFAVEKQLFGKTVLLIDDIKTTGYTLNECAKQLRLQGAGKVWCLTALVNSFDSCKESEDNI